MSAIEQYLAQLAVADPDERRLALERALAQAGLQATIQIDEATEQNPRPAQNYLLLPEGSAEFPLFCAHYDSFPASSGANDNAAAVCILIALAQTCLQSNIRAGFAFFDGEEKGHSGAKLFERERNGMALSAVINLDMCGYGDTIAVYCSGSMRKSGIKAFCDKAILKKHHATLVEYLPESDNICFRTRHQPVLNVAVIPRWDLSYLHALSTYRGGFLGKPPEFHMMFNQLEVVTTMHGGFRDDIKWVSPTAMGQLYDYLLEGLQRSSV